MASNSVVSASIPNASKDLGKKKRANRSAKLKQCKLDARREQWLSHARNKTCKDERNGIFAGEINTPPTEIGDKSDPHFEDIETRRQVVENNYLIHLDSDSESPANSPTSSLSGGNVLTNSYTGGDSSRSSRSCSSSSSFSSGGCCSGSITEEEEEDGCLDDWEAVADALAADENPPQNSSTESITVKEAVQLDSVGKSADQSNKVTLGLGDVASTRAWRADDAFRPQSLPSLLKQKSFPMNLERCSERGINPWGCNLALSVPTSCPICYEDLDLTDSSFLPCLCGFRLCLFCHKRILEGDGRCPGCRKPYELDAVQKQASDAGGNYMKRLEKYSANSLSTCLGESHLYSLLTGDSVANVGTEGGLVMDGADDDDDVTNGGLVMDANERIELRSEMGPFAETISLISAPQLPLIMESFSLLTSANFTGFTM
ncbi:hypothetical protein V2J09_006780 [Rumex salicifolius]